jgi:aminopeptidase N/puromycin-sensitive aminopeptidase
VLEVAATSNDPHLFQQYMAAMSNPKSSPEQLTDYSHALAKFTDPKLVEQWLQRIVAPETRSQDAAGYLGRVLENPAVQKVAWDWTKLHWAEVESKLTMSSGFDIVNATGRFCDTGMRDDVQQFFAEHKVTSTERTLRQSQELSDSCIRFRSGQQPNLAVWLQQHSANASAGAQ